MSKRRQARGQWLAPAIACLLLAGCFSGEKPLPPGEALARAARSIQAILDDENAQPHPVQPDSEDAPAHQKTSEVVFWFCTHPIYSRLAMDSRLITAFNADNPGTTLSAVYIGDWYVAVQKLVVTLAAGDLPDVALVNRDWTGRLARAGLLAELDALLPAEFVAEFDSNALQSMTLNGHLYGLPADGFCSALFYNRKLAGDTAPATWAGLERLARQTKSAVSGARETWYPIGDLPFIESLWSAGGYVCDERNNGLERPEARETLDFILKLRDEGLVHPWAMGNPDRAFDLFLRGDVALTTASSENIARTQEAPFAVGIAPIPGKTGPISRLSENVLVVFRKHAEKKRATLVQALRFLTGPALLSESPARPGSAPIRASLEEQFPVSPGLVEAYHAARAIPLMASWSPIEFELNRYLDLARRYQASPAP